MIISFITLISLLNIVTVKAHSLNILATLSKVPEDGILTFSQLASKYGHPAEKYNVTTEDGYILKLYNLPGDKKRPVLLIHGVFDTSDGWLIRGNESLAMILAEEGYDVWALNFRGNRYSRKHESLNPDSDSKFWDYSAHEYGYYDLRAGIDFVLSSTNQSQLSIVGFSEGTTSVLILASTLPEYNEKVKVFIALAPIAFLHNTQGLLSFIIQFSPVLNFFLPAAIDEVTGYYSLMKAIINLMCTQLVIGYDLCYHGGFNALSGTNTLGIEKGFFLIVIGHFPAGTSRKNLMHFAQIGVRQTFAQYDYGAGKNLKTYGSFTPPVYDLTKVTMKTVLVSGRNDFVSDLKDVELLKGKLPNVEEHKIIDRETFNHLDHLWANDAPQLSYGFVVKTLDKFS